MARNTVDYEDDFYAWTVEQSRLLRSRDLSAIDVANIAEEIESMGRSDLRALESRLIVLPTHLLKWRIQQRMRSSSWSGTIGERRRRIARLLQESPSLRPFVDEALAEAYSAARQAASNQTGLLDTEFPAECPFTADQVLSDAFLPER